MILFHPASRCPSLNNSHLSSKPAHDHNNQSRHWQQGKALITTCLSNLFSVLLQFFIQFFISHHITYRKAGSHADPPVYEDKIVKRATLLCGLISGNQQWHSPFHRLSNRGLHDLQCFNDCCSFMWHQGNFMIDGLYFRFG